MSTDPAAPTDELAEAWRRLDPRRPLPPGSPWYVDCWEERGTSRFVEHMARTVTWSAESSAPVTYVHDLVVGHRGSGKSTELLRLKARLEDEGFYVHYVDIAEEMEADDVDCEAVVTIALRRLVADLGEMGIGLNEKLLQQVAEWFGERVKTVVGSKSAQVGVDVDAGLGSKTPLVSLFAKLTGFMRWGTSTEERLTVAYMRYLSELREQVQPLLDDANLQLQKRPETPKGLVTLIDSLDHIRLESRQDEVFIDSAEVLTGLQTHMVLTAPAALLTAGRGSQVEHNFACHWLPIVKVRTLEGDAFPAGEAKMREIIARRCDPALFSDDALQRICRYSGGHTRHLIRLAQDAISDTVEAPVSVDSANRAIASLSNTLATGRTPEEWDTLAATHRDPLCRPFSPEGRELLFHDCILTHENAEEMDDECIPSQWYVVHPCLQRLKPFKDALASEAE